MSDLKKDSLSKKKCPYCAEEILSEAIKCKFCKEDLSKSENNNLDNPNIPQQKKCPHCAEEIAMEAIKCKHCGEKLYYDVAENLGNTFGAAYDVVWKTLIVLLVLFGLMYACVASI